MRGVYLVAMMTSISVIGGFSLAIGILGGGELGGEGVCEGATGNESQSGMGNKRLFKERGVTRISLSNPRPGGENSAGTLPKFRKRETCEGGLSRN
jgi:hypothetical protein